MAADRLTDTKADGLRIQLIKMRSCKIDGAILVLRSCTDAATIIASNAPTSGTSNQGPSGP